MEVGCSRVTVQIETRRVTGTQGGVRSPAAEVVIPKTWVTHGLDQDAE